MHNLTNNDLSDEEVLRGNMIIHNFVKQHRNDPFGGHINKFLNAGVSMLYFHASIDWIYPVVDKIERLGYNTTISRVKDESPLIYHCIIAKEHVAEGRLVHEISNYKITAIWNAVIEFCKLNITENAT